MYEFQREQIRKRVAQLREAAARIQSGDDMRGRIEVEHVANMLEMELNIDERLTEDAAAEAAATA